jgi:uncharacterized protein
MIRRIFLALFALTGVVAFGGWMQIADTESGPQTGLRVEALSVITPQGRRDFRVEIAETPAQREIGMMWRVGVSPGQGMLFDFRQPQQAAFWMKNTLIPLDIIYIRADGTIANIAANAQPLSLVALPSAGPVRGVLEIGGGEAARRVFPPPPRAAPKKQR